MNIKSFFGKLWQSTRRNPFSKIVALIFALLLWNYVMSATDVMRRLTFSDMNVILSGESVLNRNDLALTENPLSDLEDVAVEINILSRDMDRVSRDNIIVRLEVGNILEAGEAEIKLSAQSNLGGVTIQSITPATATVQVEPRISRSVLVEAAAVGAPEENYWYSTPNSDPRSVQVSGPQSIVETVAKARAEASLTGVTEEYRMPLRFKLMDAMERVIPTDQLEINIEAVTVLFNAAPQREYDLSALPLYIGQPAEGYRVKSATIQPQSILLAARQPTLDALPGTAAQLALFNPVDIAGMENTLTSRLRLSLPDGVFNSSAPEVYITIEIEKDES